MLVQRKNCYNKCMRNHETGPRGGLTFIHDGEEFRIVPRDYEPIVGHSTNLSEQAGGQARSFAERHPDWPKVNLLLDFAPHVTSNDLAHFEKKLAEADI